MDTSHDKSGFYAVFLFLLWPFLALLSAFKNHRKAWAKNIFWAFCAFYGLTFTIGAESESSDVVRYVIELETLHKSSMTVDRALEYYDRSGEVDIFRTIIAITLSRFTDSQPVMTLVFAIIFGYFFSRNIWYILDRLRGKLLPITIVFLVCFMLMTPVWSINAFRMSTANQMFIFGLLPFLCEGKKNRLWISAASILVHFALLVPVGVVAFYMLAGNRLTLYYGFFMVTFFVSEIDIELLNRLAESYLPEAFQERSESYRREDRVEEFREVESERNWYANWYRPALHWALMGFLSVLFIRERSFFNSNKNWLSLFAFVLLYFGVANLFSTIPSGHRYLATASLLAMALLMFYLQNRPPNRLMTYYTYASSPAIALYLVVSIRETLYFTGTTTILGNPVIAFLTAGNDLSLNDLMRMIL